MKNLLFTSIILYSSFTLFAQKKETKVNPTDKGHFIIDGSLYIQTNNVKTKLDKVNFSNRTSFNFNTNPKAAYFIADRFALGLTTSFGYSSYKSTRSDGTKYSGNGTSIGAGLFLRYYLVNGIFGQASLGLGTNYNNNNNSSKNSNNNFSSRLAVGYAIFLNQHTSLEPIISYEYRKYTDNSISFESNNNGLSLGAGFSIYL